MLAVEWLFRLFKMSLSLPEAIPQLLARNVIHLTISMPTGFVSRRFWNTWTPGSHVRLSIPSIGLLQPHPFTIASIASDGNIQLYIRARKGLTQRLYEKTAGAILSGRPVGLKVHFEGLYLSKTPSFQQFDVVLLVSSGIGVTFTIPILRDLVQHVKQIEEGQNCRCKRIGFVWVVKHQGSFPMKNLLIVAELSWFANELSNILDTAYGLVAMRLYVTRDPEVPFTPLDNQNDDDAELEKPGYSVPDNVVPYLRIGRPNLPGLVQQAAAEAKVMGRLGVATCGSRDINKVVKKAVIQNLSKDMPDIYCHAEGFDY